MARRVDPADRPPGEDALLLLRPAVRHPAEGARRQGRRLRALGGVPLQQGDALPQGREALHAEHPSRSPARSPDPDRRRLPQGGLGRVPGPRRATPARAAGAPRPDAVAVYGGASLTTEKSYLLGKFARVALGHAPHRLQRTALHGLRRGRLQDHVRRRPRAQPVGGHRPGGRGDARGLERRRVLAHHHQLPAGACATAAGGSSSSIRA